MTDQLHLSEDRCERFLLRDDVFRFLVTGAETDGTYSLTRVDVPVGGGPGPHRHSSEEWFYVLAGRASFHLGPERLDVSTGDLVRVPPGTEHWFEVPDAPLRLLSGFVPAGEEEVLRGLARTVD